MALTRITKGVIKPNENYDTHNIVSTGIVTAVGLDINGNADVSGNFSVGGVLTYEDVTSIDSVGIITAQKGIHVGAGISVVGVGTFGSLDISGDIDVDGHTNLDNVSVAGVTTFNNDVHFKLNDKLYFGNNNELEIYQQGNNTFIFNNDDTFAIGQSGQGAAHPMKIYGGTEFELKHYHTNGGQNSVFKSIRGGAFTLYHAGSNNPSADQIRLETTSTGLNFPRDIDVDGHTNLDNVSIAGVTTITQDLDVDGHTNLDNVSVAGVITATTFIGDGSDLTNLPAGLGTALSSTATSPLNKMYYTNSVLGIAATTTVDVPASASAAYTQYADINIATDADLIIADGDDLIPDVLGLADFGTFGGGTAGRLRVSSISNHTANGAPTVQHGLVITGVTTSTNVSVASSVTATTFYGSGANLTGLSGVSVANQADNRLITATGTTDALNAESNVHIDSNGRLIIADTDTVNAFSGGDDLVIGNNNSGTRSGLSIVSHSAQDGGIYFSKGTSNDQVRGQIVYQHDGNGGFMRLYTNADERVRITATGQLEVGSTNTINSGDFAHIEAPTSFNSGETIVTIAGNSTTTGPRLNLQNKNTGANACSEILGADAGGQSTSYIRFNHIDQTNNHGEISFGTRNAQGTPPAEVMRINKDGLLTKPNTPFVMVHINTTTERNSTGSQLIVRWDTIHQRSTNSNMGSHFNTSNHRFTAPVDGRYLFVCSMNIVGDNIMYHRINGSNVHGGEYRISQIVWDHLDSSFIYDMNANDYYDMTSRLYDGAGQRWNGGGNGTFGWDALSIYLLG